MELPEGWSLTSHGGVTRPASDKIEPLIGRAEPRAFGSGHNFLRRFVWPRREPPSLSALPSLP